MMYNEPEWSKETVCPGFFEVVKSGTILERIPIAKGTKIVSFGRLPENSVQLDHESISRHHAVVQFGPGNTAFLYDLGSTHGTFLNKQQVPSLQYVKITPDNDIFFFGGSTRRFVLALPPVPVEKEHAKPEANDQIESSKASCRPVVLKFFEENGINQKDIEFVNENGLLSCCLDYSEYVSIDQEAVIVSSGADKAEAYDNFFEDSFNLLHRLGLISNNEKAVKKCEASEGDDVEYDNEYNFSEDDSRPTKKSKGVISETELVAKRDSLREIIHKISIKLTESRETVDKLELEEVDDFDIYIKEAKIEQLRADIHKYEAEEAKIQKELDETLHILKVIGHRESDYFPPREAESRAAVQQEVLKPYEAPKPYSSPTPASASMKAPIPPSQSSTSEEEPEYNQFEDATDPTESTEQLEKLKKKLGY